MVRAASAAALVCGLAVVAPTTVDAAPVYCAVQPAGGLDESNVTFRGANADDCFGVVSGNPSISGAPSGWTVNTLNGGLFGGGWDAVVKDDGAAGTLSYVGLNWTLSAPQQSTSGNWSLSLTDPGAVSLPVKLDMMVTLKGSTNWAAYLFTGETFAVAGANPGTFQIAFTGANGKNIPGLSNMAVYFRAAATQVPEPATLTLLGLGLLGASFAQRRNRKVASR